MPPITRYGGHNITRELAPGLVPGVGLGNPNIGLPSGPYTPSLRRLQGVPQSPNTNIAGPAPGVVPNAPYGEPIPPAGRLIGDDDLQGIGQIYPNPNAVPFPQPKPSPTIPSPKPNPLPPINTGGGGGTGLSTTNPSQPTTQTPAMGMPNINTSITPLITYPYELTEQARNQIVASQAQASDPRWLTKRFASPGRSSDAGIASAAMPYLAQGQFLGNQGYANLSLGDYLANQESLLAGEIAREKEGLGLGNLLARLQEGQTASANSLLNPLLSQLLR